MVTLGIVYSIGFTTLIPHKNIFLDDINSLYIYIYIYLYQSQSYLHHTSKHHNYPHINTSTHTLIIYIYMCIYMYMYNKNTLCIYTCIYIYINATIQPYQFLCASGPLRHLARLLRVVGGRGGRKIGKCQLQYMAIRGTQIGGIYHI